MICNTQTCTGYSANVLGNGTQNTGVREFWIKNSGGSPLTWEVFSEDSQHFGGTIWLAIRYKEPFASNTEVARVRVFDCNNSIVEIKPLTISAGMRWAKWTFTSTFGQTCHNVVTKQFEGASDWMPSTPPPL